MATHRLTDAEQRYLQRLYDTTPSTVDQMVYTAEFDDLYQDFVQKTGRSDLTKNQVWNAMANLRKKKDLARKYR